MPEGGDDAWVAEVVLSDGESVLIRPLVPDDAESLRAFHRRQSPESIYRRYFTPKPDLSAQMARRFTSLDADNRAALGVLSGEELIGWASYERWTGRDDAEVAFMVDDAHRGKGIATLLLEHLAAIARSRRITRFTAETLAENEAMLSVFKKAGWPLQQRYESGVFDIDFDLTDDAGYVDSVERREQRADSKAMARLLLPRTIAVIGASERPGSVGAALWTHLRRAFAGSLYAVNPNHERIDGEPSYASVADIVDDISLAVIAVPVAAVTATVEACIAKHVRGAVIVTDVHGSDVDVHALVSRARRSGMRIIGPASMGVASPPIGLQSALVDVTLPPGNVAISMQSGSLGGSLLRQAADASLGLSWFVSLGDKSDVSANDLLQFWSDDESTAVIGLYTESFGNPSRFARIARRVAMSRPIVAVRTGAAAVSDAANAIYRRAGVIEVPTVAALLDTVRVFSTQPVPAGPRVAVLSNSRSPGLLAEAAITAAGLQPVQRGEPLDWRSSGDDFGRAVSVALRADDVDAVMVIHAPAVHGAGDDVAARIDEAVGGAEKPVVAVMLGTRDGPLRPGSRVPAFSFPEQIAAVLGRMHAYARWRRAENDAPSAAPGGLRPDDAARLIEEDLARVEGEDEATSLDLARIAELLETYGVRFARAETASSVDGAVAAAAAIGYPVALKAHRRRIGRSAEAGVALDVDDDHGVTGAFETMQASLGADALPLTVQAMVPPGVDVRIRVRNDVRVGAVVEVGLGGVQADVIDAGSQRLLPMSAASARGLVEDSRVGAALREAELDDADLVDTIVRIGQLGFRHGEVRELELNPVIVSPDGCWAVDARAHLTAPGSIPPLRRLD